MKKKYYWIVGIVVIIIIVGILFLFTKPSGIPISSPTSKGLACTELVKSNCEKTTNSIIVKNFDANKDGKIDSSDTLFELCKNYYGRETDSECKRVCDCP